MRRTLALASLALLAHTACAAGYFSSRTPPAYNPYASRQLNEQSQQLWRQSHAAAQPYGLPNRAALGTLGRPGRDGGYGLPSNRALGLPGRP